MGFDESFDDGESESSAAIGTATGRVDAVEAVEKFWEMLRADADAVVLDRDDPMGRRRRELDDDLVVGWGVEDGVFQEIEKHAAEGDFIAGHGIDGILWELNGELN